MLRFTPAIWEDVKDVLAVASVMKQVLVIHFLFLDFLSKNLGIKKEVESGTKIKE